MCLHTNIWQRKKTAAYVYRVLSELAEFLFSMFEKCHCFAKDFSMCSVIYSSPLCNSQNMHLMFVQVAHNHNNVVPEEIFFELCVYARTIMLRNLLFWNVSTLVKVIVHSWLIWLKIKVPKHSENGVVTQKQYYTQI